MRMTLIKYCVFVVATLVGLNHCTYTDSVSDDDDETESAESTTYSAITSNPSPLFSYDSNLYTFGYEVKRRAHLDHWNNSVLLLHPSDTFNHSGFIHSWHFYANRTVNLTLQIWRPSHFSVQQQYTLVGQNFYNVSSLGVQNVVVTTGQRISFKEGDIIGIYFPSSNPIPFSKRTTNCSYPTLYLHMTRPMLRRSYPFRAREDGWNPCRIYSIHIQISNSSSTESTASTSLPTANIPKPSYVPTEPVITEPPAIDIKLESGRTGDEGLVYVRAPSGDWGTVCDDAWDNKDANVVCVQRGYSGGIARYPPFFGQGRGVIYLDDVRCNGSETKLVDCARGGQWGNHDCFHREDAGVECYRDNNGTEHVFGYPAVQRAQTELRWIKGIYIPYPHQQIPWERATITEWHFYIQTVASADLSLQVWRRKSQSMYSLVGETVFKGLRPGRHDVILNSREKILVEAGDVFGVMFSQFNAIPFDLSRHNCEAVTEVMIMDNLPPSIHVGDVYGFQSVHLTQKQCHIYSLYAKLETQRRSTNYQFSSGRSQYMVVTDMSLSHEAANRKCSKLLGPTAKLLNVTTEEEYYVINGALNAMDIKGGSVFWIAGYVNQPYEMFYKWGHCEPTEGKECIVMNNWEPNEATYSDSIFKMYSKTCHHKYKFICELESPDPSTTYKPASSTVDFLPFPKQVVTAKHNLSSSEVVRMKTIPPSKRSGMLAGIIVMVFLLVSVIIFTSLLLYRRCSRRLTLGPNDISESTVRFVSLHDKPPM